MVPFESIVLDEVSRGAVGFITRFMPGGTVEGKASRPFKLQFARQLVQMVDDLSPR
jgi:hypothetical protein